MTSRLLIQQETFSELSQLRPNLALQVQAFCLFA
jgi:hypothetical protein